MRRSWTHLTLSGAILLASGLACSPGDRPSPDADLPAEQLGFVDFTTSCDPSVADDMDRAVALLHHMTYPVAQSGFDDVAVRDPECAMAYWGAATTLFQPLWPTRPGEEELRRGWALIQQARRSGRTSPREEMFVAATGAFFDPAAEPDYWTRIERWAVATTALYEAYPDDLEARAFYALAQLATASRFGMAAEHHERAHQVLAGVLDEQPTHPGAVHYTIHASDFAGREDRSLSVVRRYGEIAPENPHALHMPTHIFVRLGNWDEVVTWNLRAAEAALAQRVGPTQEYVWDEYPHAVEYLVYAYLQQGDDVLARGAIRDMNDTPDLQPSFKTAFHLASTAARFALERRDWPAAADLPARSPSSVDWDRYRWPEAIVRFARGMGAVHGGDDEAVARSLERIRELSAGARDAGEGPFAAQIEVLRLELLGWQAHGRGESATAVAFMEEAVDLEAATPKHPVTPGATLPALELLGDLHLALDDPDRALASYRASEARTPGRFNTVLGLARSLAAAGDDSGARVQYDRLLELAVGDSPRDALTEARAYIAR